MLSRNIVRRFEKSSVIRLSARSFLASSSSSSLSSSSAPTTQKSSNNNSNHSHHHGETPLFLGAGLLGGLSAVAVTMMEQQQQQQQQAAHKEQKRPGDPGDSSAAVDGHVKHGKLDNIPPPRPDLPTYTMEQVAEHSDEESMWFSYRGGVYDLTFFILGHPGGTPRLLMAAGQDLEPYWDVYRQHFRGHVVDWMEKYRIGNLDPKDPKRATAMTFGDMYENDPKRHPDLLHCTEKPFNGEPRIQLLTKDFITPNHLFYVRNHLAVPDIDPKEYVLIVKGKGIKKHKFTLEDLETKFPKHEVVSALQCAGNRREDLHSEDHKIFIAPHWVVGAMSCAKWGGAKLRDVLKHCGLDVDGMALGEVDPGNIRHVQFEGYDTDESGLCYGGSIPIDKAVDGLGDCLLCYEMNDEPLMRDHGFPVRAIAPGHAGARQCKWLHKIIVSDKESQKSWQQKSYRGFAPDVDFEKDLSHWPPPRLDQAPIVQELPVQSFVCNPAQNTIVGAKGSTDIELKGVAWSGGGRKIERVDVSIDGGTNWTAAELYKPIEQKRNRHWAWTQFYKTMPLTDDMKEKLNRGQTVQLDIVSKAMNSDFNVQPERMEPYWNARGVGINHWYHVKTTLDPKITKGTESSDPALAMEFGNTPSTGTFVDPWDMHGWTADEIKREK